MRQKLGSLFLLLCWTSKGFSQDIAESLSDLPSRLRQGDRIEITDITGLKLRGRYEGVGASSVRLRGAGKSIQDVPDTMIREISKERRDSKMNGLLIGLGAGAGAAIIATSATCTNDPECEAAAGAIFVPVFVGGGAGVGLLIDSFIKKYHPVYRITARAGPTIRVSPLATNNVKGIGLAVSF